MSKVTAANAKETAKLLADVIAAKKAFIAEYGESDHPQIIRQCDKARGELVAYEDVLQSLNGFGGFLRAKI